MNAETTKTMQEALQAAVMRMNQGPAETQAGPIDTIGALMSILPKLLQNNESSDEMLEKLDSLQKGDLTSIREQLQVLRKQSYRGLKVQEQLLAKVDEIQRQQTAIANAVLDLAQQVARITLMDDLAADEDDYEREAPLPPEGYRRAEPRMSRDGRGRSQRDT